MKYPAIYKSVEGSEYLYQNKDSYYCYERQVWDSSEPHHDCHHSDTNITTEYLTNTYGEVKSKEHAEFIVELAEVNNFRLCNPEKTDKKWFCFDDNELYFFDDVEDASDLDEKQITIPLPPESNVNTPEEDFEMTQVAKNNGYNLIFGGDDKCKEWPCVNDGVEAKHPSGQTLKGKLLAKTKEYTIIQQLGHEQHLHLSAWKFSKPKTPEEELRDELVELALSHIENKEHPIEANAYYLVSEIIEKYIKKPQ